MKRTLIAVLALVGCGLPNESDEVGTARGEEAVTVAHPSPVHAVPPDVLTLQQRATGPEALAVSFAGLPERGHLYAVVGMLSCGFLEVGRADAEIFGGAVNLNVPLQPQTRGEQWSVFFYVSDGSGRCQSEMVQSAKLPELPSKGVKLDVRTLPASYGAGCWAFQ